MGRFLRNGLVGRLDLPSALREERPALSLPGAGGTRSVMADRIRAFYGRNP